MTARKDLTLCTDPKTKTSRVVWTTDMAEKLHLGFSGVWQPRSFEGAFSRPQPSPSNFLRQPPLSKICFAHAVTRQHHHTPAKKSGVRMTLAHQSETKRMWFLAVLCETCSQHQRRALTETRTCELKQMESACEAAPSKVEAARKQISSLWISTGSQCRRDSIEYICEIQDVHNTQKITKHSE